MKNRDNKIDSSYDVVDLHAPWVSKRWMNGQNPLHDLLLDVHDRALEHNPPRIKQWWIDQEDTEYSLELFDRALLLYNATITLDSTCIPAYIQKGRLLSLFEQEENARVTFQQALEKSLDMGKKDPTYAKAFLFQGDVLFLLGKEEEALKSYEQAIQVAPENSDVYVNKGWLLFTLLRTEALAAYDRALTLTSDDPDIYYRKGLLLSEMRRYQEALQNYEKAIQLAPTYFPYYEAKCSILYYLGRGQEVPQILKEARNLVKE